jgi:galactokinase
VDALVRVAGPFDPATATIVRAPGRVNLIGEHTDYNEGYALPFAIDLEIRIASIPADDGRVDLTRLDTGERDGFRIDAVGARRGGWIDYVAGTAWSLADDDLPVRAVRGVIASTLPASSGLSSSAALELASVWTLGNAPDATDPIRVVRLCQRAENAYVGVRTGIMDQFACAMARPGAAVLLDCRSLDWRPVALPLDRASIVVVDSGSSRSLDGSAYNERRSQCEHGVEVIARSNPGVRALRDVTPAMLEAAAPELDPVTLHRCRHVVAEDERVLATAEALEAGDLDAVGDLLVASHESLRDLYEVSSAELDALVEIATAVPGVFGARMTGAGFGGCIVAIAAPDAVETLAAAIRSEYPPRAGLEPRIWAVTPVAGAGWVADPA